MIKSDRDLRPEPGYVSRDTSTVVEMRAARQGKGALLVLKDAVSGAWYYEADRPAKFGGRIAHRERKGFRVSEAYWLPPGARRWRPISLPDVREVYRLG